MHIVIVETNLLRLPKRRGGGEKSQKNIVTEYQ